MRNTMKETPRVDKIMFELGWTKYGDNKVFYRKITGMGKYKYFVSFPIDVDSYYNIYEDMLDNTEEFTAPIAIKQVLMHFNDVTANTYVKSINKGELELLTADYYWHNNDQINHLKYVDLYEKKTGKKYR